MGAPRLHFHLRHKLQSFLLDLDERFAGYLGPEEFCLYNMCNNHFFYNRKPFEQFLECKKLVIILKYISSQLRSFEISGQINC